MANDVFRRVRPGEVVFSGRALAESVTVDVPCDRDTDPYGVKTLWSCPNPNCGTRDVTLAGHDRVAPNPAPAAGEPKVCPTCKTPLRFRSYLAEERLVPADCTDREVMTVEQWESWLAAWAADRRRS
jgi:hypothetical protein